MIPNKKLWFGATNSLIVTADPEVNIWHQVNESDRVQRGGGHRDLPEAREEPLQEAVHAPRHHAEMQVSQNSGAAGYGDRVADKLNYRTCAIAVLRIRGSGAFLTLDPGSGMGK